MSQTTVLSWQRKQPLVLVTIFFAAGILVQQIFHLSWSLDSPNEFWSQPVTYNLALFVACSLAWAFVSARALPPPWPILPLVVATGTLLAAYQNTANEGWSPIHLRRLVLRLPQHVTLRGVIRSDPALRMVQEHPRHSTLSVQATALFPQEPGLRTPSFAKATAGTQDLALSPHPSPVLADFELEVSAVRFLMTWEPARGRVMVRAREAVAAPLEFGQEIEVDGVLSEPERARNFGMFDYAAYLRGMGILHVMRATDSDSVRVLGVAEGWGWIFAARKKLSERLTLGIQEDQLAVNVIRGTLLGYREDIPQDVGESFRRTGTLHAFVISGLRIAMIAFALLAILRLLRVPQRWVCVVVLPLLGFYVAATGLRASALRSFITAGVIIAGWSLRRPSVPLNSLAASALIILAWDPFQLFDPGAQLSFVVVATLILLSPPIERWLLGWIEPDPYIPRSCLPRWRLRLMPWFREPASLVAVGFAAWIGSFGINLYYFNLVSFTSVVANLLIVPMASASVALGMTSLLLGLIWDQIAITLNITHSLLIHFMLFITEKFAWIPNCCFYTSQPSVAWIVAGYGWLGCVILAWFQQKRLFSVVLGFAGACVVGVVSLAAWLSDEVQVDVLDVGGGQAVLVSGPHFERVLLDAGSANQGRTIVEPFLRSRGVNRVDALIVSQGGSAHYGGVGNLIGKVPFDRVIVADAAFRAKGYRQLLATLEQAHVPIERWHAEVRGQEGETGRLGEAGDKGRRMTDHERERGGNLLQLHSGVLSALWPPSPGEELEWKSNRADDSGLILELRTKFGRCLFAGKPGGKIETVLSPELHPPYQLLVQGLRANEESLTTPYLSCAALRVIVVNTAEYPLSAYPSPDVQARLKLSGAQVYRTDQSGGVTVWLKKEGIQSRSFLQ